MLSAGGIKKKRISIAELDERVLLEDLQVLFIYLKIYYLFDCFNKYNSWDRCWRLWFIARENHNLQTLLEHTLYRNDALKKFLFPFAKSINYMSLIII